MTHPDHDTPHEDESQLRLRLDLSYDGTGYHGWATQPGLTTVQGVVEEALEMILRRPVSTVVAGRTDAGVHAHQQVVHIDITDTEYAGLTRGRDHIEPLSTLVRRLNGALRQHHGLIHFTGAQLMPAEFDARFSPIWRQYTYRVADGPEHFDPLTRRFVYWHKNPLNTELMAAETTQLLGLHDFLSFCKPRPTGTTIRELQDISIERTDSGAIEFGVRADAFCHHMVRALVGALIKVGEGSQEPGWAVERLNSPRRDSQMWLAPAHGLTLQKVGYPALEDLGARAEQTRAKRPAK